MKTNPTTVRALACAVVLGASLAAAPWSMADEARSVRPQRADWALLGELEQWQLPAGESMGMARLGLRRELTPYLSAGVDSFAAVRGSRGGFITLGVGGELHLPIARRTHLDADLSITAGGGRGGFELAGGGLMLREGLGVSRDFPRLGTFGVGVSHVDFPNGGVIHSSQLYLSYRHPFSSLYVPEGGGGGPELSAAELAAWRPSAPQLSIVVQSLKVGSGAHQDTGAPQANFGLVGVEWQTHGGAGAYAHVRAAGAASGGSTGYMQILGGVGYRWALTPGIGATVAASVGAGGGGAVDTGGGLLLEGAAGLEYRWSTRNVVALSATRLKAPSGSLTATGLGLSVGHRFGSGAASTADTAAPSQYESHPVRLRVVDQQYHAAHADWTSRPNREFGTLGLQADYFVTPGLYLTGQGLGAYSGRNGAYMIGLVGAGLHVPAKGRWYAEAEALLGAAGGGGVLVGSGLVGQLNAGVGYRNAHGVGMQLSIGRLQGRRGPFAANVLGLALTYQTTLLTPGP